jgi:hypothetical protein
MQHTRNACASIALQAVCGLALRKEVVGDCSICNANMHLDPECARKLDFNCINWLSPCRQPCRTQFSRSARPFFAKGNFHVQCTIDMNFDIAAQMPTPA